MKKILLALAVFCACGVSALAQGGTLVATLSAVPSDHDFTITLASAVGATDYQVDFGDGRLVAGSTTQAYDGYDGSVEITGKPAGTGIIKIYTAGTITYLAATGRVDNRVIKGADLTRLTDLTNLELGTNLIENIDLSKNTKLTTLDLNNNKLSNLNLNNLTALTRLTLTDNFPLSALDLSANTELKALRMNNCTVHELDLSSNTKLRDCYVVNNRLIRITVGKKEVSGFILSVANNKLTTLDVTQAAGLKGSGRLFVTNNNLTELKYDSIGTANLSGNKFTFATLPTRHIGTLIYAPQQPMEIAFEGATVDLSAQQADTYTWYDADDNELTEGTDYTSAAGKFTFIRDLGKEVYCVMKSARFPKFVGSSVFRTVTVKPVTTAVNSVEAETNVPESFYTVNGVFAGTDKARLARGLYIVKSGSKVKKFLVK